MLLKVCLSKANKTLFPLLLIVAALGALYKRANSPKAYPGTYFFKNLFYPPSTNFR
jgi:hypothetical protein